MAIQHCPTTYSDCQCFVHVYNLQLQLAIGSNEVVWYYSSTMLHGSYTYFCECPFLRNMSNVAPIQPFTLISSDGRTLPTDKCENYWQVAWNVTVTTKHTFLTGCICAHQNMTPFVN